MKAIQINHLDTVAVALCDIKAGEYLTIGGKSIVAVEPIPIGHKVALMQMAAGAQVIKYGAPIGVAANKIVKGDHVHTHNTNTTLTGVGVYNYKPTRCTGNTSLAESFGESKFYGYRRHNGRVGTRNEIWIISTVGCVNGAAEQIAKLASEKYENQVDGVFAIRHSFGCSQLGDDLADTQKILAGLIDHPNAGGVLVLGLGCESNQAKSLLSLVTDKESERIQCFDAQSVDDEIDAGLVAIAKLVEIVGKDHRSECSISELTVGLKCGGSDSFSGLTANPLVGQMCDLVTHFGGRTILSEIPEIFGAEENLMNRCFDKPVFERLVGLVNDFKQYFIDHDQPIYENPSPGNIAGGISTLEEKSLGATQKGGSATVMDVLRYGGRVCKPGLTILEAPGNDSVSSTAMVASGATILLFTTGRGTPLGAPVPTIKISSNSNIAEKKAHWIDFDAGSLLRSDEMQEVASQLARKMIDVVSGMMACNERNGEREITIWKRGVTL